MPLAKQLLTFPFALGVDSKTDDKQLALGRLHDLENGIFTTLKQLRKRNGYDDLTARAVSIVGGVLQSERLASASALTAYRDELLLVARTEERPSLSQLFSYSAGAEAWIAKGTFTPCDVETAPVYRSLGTIGGSDGCILDSGALQVYAWEDGASVYYSVVDTVSGQLVIDQGLVASTGQKPRVVPFAGGAVIYFVDPTTTRVFVRVLTLYPIPTLQPAAAITGTAVGAVGTFTTTSSRRAFDVIRVDDQLFFAFNNDAGTITAQLFNGTDPYNATVQRTISPAFTSQQLACFYDLTGQRVGIFYGAGTASAYTLADRYLSAAFATPVALPTFTGYTIQQLAAVAVPEAADASRFRFWSSGTDGSSRWATRLHWAGPSSTGATRTMRTLAIAAKPWSYLGQGFIPLVFVSRTTGATSGYGSTGIQNQILVVSDATDQVDTIARALYGTSVGAPFSSSPGPVTVPGSWPLGATAFRTSAMEYTLAESTQKLAPGIVSLAFDLGSVPLSDNRSEIAETLVLGGGVTSLYDGVDVSELNFLAWPDELTVASSAGSNLSAGTYQWVAVYEWMDNTGNVHRSAPSLPATITLAAPATATATVSTLQFTRKQTPVKIVLYRTTANGTTFYRVSDALTPTSNDPTVYTVTIADTLTDAQLASRAQLYTTGGVVENVAPPPLASLAVHRSRLWGIEATNRLRLWYSRQVQTGAPVEFSDALVFDVDARGGDVTALASLDDKLIVFKRTAILAVAGQGPDATGRSNDFSDAVFVTSDVGCVDSRSLVVTPSGLIFQTTKGIYLLDRSLAVSYVGADVERYNAATVESSQLIPTVNQVRFLLSSGVALVYDFFVGQWSVFTNHSGVDSVVWLERFAYLRTDGRVLVENPARFDDAGTFVPLKITTGWIAFDNIGAGAYAAANGNRGAAPVQVFQRARRLLILGDYKGPHQLQVDVSFNFAESPLQTVMIAPTDPTTYGEDSPFGSGSPYGGTWTPYQYRIDLEQQKCQAIRVALTEVRPRENIGAEGVRLSALAFEIGVKSGLFRVPMGSVYG